MPAKRKHSVSKLPAHEVRRLAVEAHRDPRTVIAVLGGNGSPMAVASVQQAAKRLGLDLAAIGAVLALAALTH